MTERGKLVAVEIESPYDAPRPTDKEATLTSAKVQARTWRQDGYSARAYSRTVRVEGELVHIGVVVVREKPGGGPPRPPGGTRICGMCRTWIIKGRESWHNGCGP